MKQLILVGNQKVKFQDTETTISLTLVSDGNTVTIDKTKTYSIKIKNGTGYVKSIDATPDTTNNMVTFSTSGLDGLPVDAYFIELWVIDNNGQTIYPSDSFIEVDITANATGVEGQVLPAITMQEFEERFSTLQSNLETKVGTLIGPTGNGISTVVTEYQLSASGINVPTGTWSKSPVPQTDDLPYLWARTTTAYTDKSTHVNYNISAKGTKGNNFTIQGSTSSTAGLPSTGIDGEGYMVGTELYVWTNGKWNDIVDMKGDKGDQGIQGIQGFKGDTGNGISSTTTDYQLSSSGNSVPTGTWSKSPVTPTDTLPYMWTRNVTTYTDKSTHVSYNISAKGTKGNNFTIQGSTSSIAGLPSVGTDGEGYMVGTELYVWTNGKWNDIVNMKGVQGDKGIQGIQGVKGDTGNGISSITTEYELSKQGTVVPSTGWSSTLLAMTNDLPYLWTRVTITFTNGSKNMVYFTSNKGDKGDTGEKGDKGDTGANLAVKGAVDKDTELPSSGNAEGDAYLVGTDLYVYTSNAWKNCGPIIAENTVLYNADGSLNVNGTNYNYVQDLRNGKIQYNDGTKNIELTPVDSQKEAADILSARNYTDSSISSLSTSINTKLSGYATNSQLATKADDSKVVHDNHDGTFSINGNSFTPAVLDSAISKNSQPIVTDVDTLVKPGLYYVSGSAPNNPFKANMMLENRIQYNWDSFEEVQIAYRLQYISGIAIRYVRPNGSLTGGDFDPWVFLSDDSKVVHDNHDGTEQLNGVQVKPFNKLSDTVGGRNLLIGSTDNIVHYDSVAGFTIWKSYVTQFNGGDTLNVSADITSNSGDTVLKVSLLSSAEIQVGYIEYRVTQGQTAHAFVSKTIPTGTTSILVRIDNGTPLGQTNVCAINHQFANTGSVATDWTPAPEDKVSVSDMRKPANDVAGIEEVNAKQDKIGYTPADDSTVLHNNSLNQIVTDNSGIIIGNDKDFGLIKRESYKGGLAIGSGNSFHFLATNDAVLSNTSEYHDVWNILPNGQVSILDGAYFTPADDSKVVHSTDMRKPANDVAGIEEVNAKQDKIGYTPADDSKVVHDNKNGTEQLNGVRVQPFNKLSDTIGGRNLVKDSEQEFTGNAYGFHDYNLDSITELAPGKTYTMSFSAKVDDKAVNCNQYLFVDIYESSWKFSPSVRVPISTDYQRVTNTFTVPESQTGVSYITAYMSHPVINGKSDSSADKSADAGTGYIKEFKLEQGSVATDWTPAPEDKVNVTDMRKPASDVAGIEEVNAKQDKIGYTPANDSSVVHNTGTEEIAGQKTFDTAPIDKATGNPYITKSGVPAVPSTLADTTKDANFTGKLQKSGIDVATTTDVSTAVNGATSQVAHLVGTNNFSTVPTVNNNPLLLASSLPSDLARTSQQTNFTAGLQSGGVDVATAADIKSIKDSAWRKLDFGSNANLGGALVSSYIVYQIHADEKYLSFFYLGVSRRQQARSSDGTALMDLSSIVKGISSIDFSTKGIEINEGAGHAVNFKISGTKIITTTSNHQILIMPTTISLYTLNHDDRRIYYTELV